jgi:hypothetical protein
LGRSPNTFNHSEDTLEIAPTAYRDGRLLMPQATEQAQNDRDEQIAERDSQLRRTLPRFCSIAWFALFASPGVLSSRVQNGKEWPPATLTTILVSGSLNAGGGFAMVTLKCSCALAEISARR